MSIRFIQPWNGYQVGQVATLSNEAALIAGGIARDSEEVDGPFYGTGIMAEMNPTGTALIDPAGGDDHQLLTRKVVLLSLTSTSSALANASPVPFTTIVRDDTGLANISTAPTKIYIPDAVKSFRVSASLSYAYATRAAGITLSSAAVGSGITVTADASVFLTTDVGKYFYSGTGRSLITGYTSGTAVTATTDMAYAGTTLASGAWTIITGTIPYRGLQLALNVNGGSLANITGLTDLVRVPTLIVGTTTEAVVKFVSSSIDTADLTGWTTGSADDNYIEVNVRHDATASTPIFGSAAVPSYLQVEMWV